MLLDLRRAFAEQGGLLDAADTARDQARMKAIDHLNKHFGRDTVSFAVSGYKRAQRLHKPALYDELE